ncbi:MAG TPA: head-tail adaptor protein [Burkholderiaceae bacterium]|nr:head-tail adaptor protein [Burkholderiaceae bacterium]
MKAGRLRHRMRIERPDPGTLDAFQGEQKRWTTVAEVDAAIDSVTGREFMQADRELAGITWRITLREIPGVVIEAGWRGIEIEGDPPRDSRVFDFIAPLPSHARNDTTLAATSGQSQP